MTEIKVTVDGQPESERGAVGAAKPSSGAHAPAEGSSAPGRKTKTADTGAAGPGSEAPASSGNRTSGTSRADGAREDDAHAHPASADPDDEAAEVKGDLEELLKTAKQRDEYLALAQRTQADFENYRKRVSREAAAARGRGVIALVKEMLPALDNLDRALEAAAEDDELLQGVRLVRSELSAALARVGVESFSPEGEQFDPAVHEAVATAEQAPEGKASGTVVEVYQDGYRMGASVIRPARVVVAA